MSDPGLDALLGAGWPDGWQCPPLEGSTAPERLRAIARSGFAGMAVPGDFQGGGASMLDVAAAQRAVSIVEPSLAIALNMHSFTVGLLREHWEVERDLSWFLLEAIAESGSLVASAFAEPGGLPHMLSAKTQAIRRGKDVELTGVKAPCSLIESAAMFCTNARLADSDQIIVALVPSGSDGMHRQPGWTGMGMRASDTGRLTLDHVVVDDRLVFYSAPADELDRMVVAGLVWFAVLLAATYHGAMTSFLVEVGARTRSPGKEGRLLLGRAVRATTALGLACQGLAHAWMDGTCRGTTALAAAQALRNEVPRVVDEILANTRPLVGSTIYTTGDRLNELSLDLLAAHHHPPSELVCDLSLGNIGVGAAPTLDPGRD